ncbi:helix-turn-helix domain-containing protein [Paenarthrobacter sp. DKR-5]|uniref:helix-turn-helix transcriptional regulator n=1 Tax=Paenarthrobacter sp. DKR-5 TaxID=2835535 RepID=UPI001BDCA010|nr:helix-turn-helix domain-containing protein [Paenarthrobacter sp. DKR-5]MBT1001849.1 helix-turn-helix domain-containing protein [Paenarthrobacter sp. DKR-5]
MGNITGSRSAAHTTAAEAEDRTRDRVLGAVLEHGPVSAAELGNLLGLTPAAVRRHLDHLSRQGIIEVKRVAKAGARAGRPARRYVLSKRGQSSLGDDYLEIARTALKQLEQLGGEAAVAEYARKRFSTMREKYRPEVDAAGNDVASRAQALSEALSRDGFVASTTTLGLKGPLAAVQLCQGHCPVQELAAEFPVFCDAETEVFAELVGVDVRRLSTLASGGHVCTTHIPTGRPRTVAALGTEVTNHQQERPL